MMEDHVKQAWDSAWTLQVLSEVEKDQHTRLRLAHEGSKGVGLRVCDDQTIPADAVFCTGVGSFLSIDDAEKKKGNYMGRSGITPYSEWGKWIVDIEVGYMDPSDPDYHLSPSRRKQTGLYWWANEPSVGESCNAAVVTIRISPNRYVICLVALRDLTAGEFVLINYDSEDCSPVGRRYHPSAEVLSRKDPRDLVVFPFLCRQSGVVTFLKFPDGQYLDTGYVAVADPTTRLFIKVFKTDRPAIDSDDDDIDDDEQEAEEDQRMIVIYRINV
eukprot:GILJ01000228.1.p1 GENE.GILJ01000228.1~~GILJ01000228.1.p1  ORF type:complete len:306 (-),score=28.79 GILJ01000228.1:122-937(-)